MTASTTSKQEGDDLYKQGRFGDAVEKYSTAILSSRSSDLHLLHSNRCACYLQVGNLESALSDAEKCIRLKPQWPKGHSRKGACLAKLERVAEAIACF
ncbi:hypothetical protein B484DRAFT_331782, partial [Ochromonadaceae sp. CCMP2298]